MCTPPTSSPSLPSLDLPASLKVPSPTNICLFILYFPGILIQFKREYARNTRFWSPYRLADAEWLVTPNDYIRFCIKCILLPQHMTWREGELEKQNQEDQVLDALSPHWCWLAGNTHAYILHRLHVFLFLSTTMTEHSTVFSTDYGHWTPTIRKIWIEYNNILNSCFRVVRITD